MNTAPAPESVLALMRKVKALADAGHEGERIAARARLDSLLAKHGITEEQLAETQRNLYGFRFKTEQEKLLIICLVAHVACDGHFPTLRRGDEHKNKVWFMLTHAEHVDVVTRRDFYLRHWKEEMRIFFRAFIYAQHLGTKPDGDSDDQELTNEQLQELRRIGAFQTFVQTKTPHRQLA